MTVGFAYYQETVPICQGPIASVFGLYRKTQLERSLEPTTDIALTIPTQNGRNPELLPDHIPCPDNSSNGPMPREVDAGHTEPKTLSSGFRPMMYDNEYYEHVGLSE